MYAYTHGLVLHCLLFHDTLCQNTPRPSIIEIAAKCQK